MAEPAIASDDEAEGLPEQHETLFLIEEAYTQEKREWQIGLALAQPLNEGGAREWEAEIEYGLTDRLQLEAEIELEQEDGNSQWENVAFGLSYGLVTEDGAARPAITIGGRVLVPTNDGEGDSRGLGFEVSTRASKRLDASLFGHVALKYAEMPDRTVLGQRLENSQWSAGAGLAYAIAPRSFLVGEYQFERDREYFDMTVSKQNSHAFSLGINHEVGDGIIFGAAAAFSRTDESEFASLLFVQAEF